MLKIVSKNMVCITNLIFIAQLIDGKGLDLFNIQ